MVNDELSAEPTVARGRFFCAETTENGVPNRAASGFKPLRQGDTGNEMFRKRGSIQMNLAEMLCYADIDQLTRIARNYECDGGSHSKNELIQSILAAIKRKESLESRMNQMSGDELRFLNSLLFENRTAYSMEELKAQAAGASVSSLTIPVQGAAGNAAAESVVLPVQPKAGTKKSGKRGKSRSRANPQPSQEQEDPSADPIRQTIVRFKHYGWLFNGFSHQTRYLYHVPDDIKRSLQEALERKFLPLLEVREEPPVYRDEGSLLIEDLETFVRFVRDHDVQLAADGAMYKRQLLQLLGLMSVHEDAPDKADGWRFGYGRKFPVYPDRFSFLYDYAYREGLVQELPDRLIVTEAGRNAAGGHHAASLAGAYRFWLRLYKIPIPNLAVLAHWIARLCTEWTTAESVYAILRPLIRPYYFDQEIDVFRKRILSIMMHLGLIRSGVTDDGELAVRSSPLGKAIVLGAKPQADR